MLLWSALPSPAGRDRSRLQRADARGDCDPKSGMGRGGSAWSVFNRRMPECHAFGYGPSRWFCPIHSPLKPELREPPGPSGDRTDSQAGRDGSRARSRSLADVHENDLRYDLARLDTHRGELWLIEAMMIEPSLAVSPFTPNEHRAARPPRLLLAACGHRVRERAVQTEGPCTAGWREVTQMAHYTFPAGALGRPGEKGNPSEPAGGGRS